jgi:HSP20 family protein
LLPLREGTLIALQFSDTRDVACACHRRIVMFEKKSLARRRQEPFNLLRQMTDELDRVFTEPWPLFRVPTFDLEASQWVPKVDVVTKDNKLVTRVDLPGMKKEDVTVEIADGLLTLSGERKKETKEEKDNFYREEREYGSFCRTVPLPKGVKPEDVKASFTNGVLEVMVPLPVAVETTPKKIAVTDGTAAATKAA